MQRHYSLHQALVSAFTECRNVTRLVLTLTNCPKHTRLGETERTWAKLEISAKVGDLDYDCDYER